MAFSESFLISRGGCDNDVSFGTAVGAAFVADGDIILFVLVLFASGEFGKDGGACSFGEASLGGGVEALVIT